jgi:predicted patatin/cPLA2 family phospholipase
VRVLDHLADLRSSADVAKKPALVVQGGGLRGVYSIGALSSLEKLDLRDSFSMVIGSSAGAMNGAYFLAGQATEGIDIYVKELSNRRFVSFRRPWRIVDIDFLVDIALKQRHPLNLAKLHAAQAPLLTVLTEAASGEERIVSNREELDLYEVMRATAALPGLYNKTVPLGDRRYLDGGLAHQVPLQEALTRGATEALVILTRGPGYRRTGHSFLSRMVMRGLARGQSLAVKQKLGAPDAAYNESMNCLESEAASINRHLWTVWPSDTATLVERTTTNQLQLQACADMGKRDMLALLQTEYSVGRP